MAHAGRGRAGAGVPLRAESSAGTGDLVAVVRLKLAALHAFKGQWLGPAPPRSRRRLRAGFASSLRRR